MGAYIDRLMVIGFLTVLLGVAAIIGADAVRRDLGRQGDGCPVEGFPVGLSQPKTIGWGTIVLANARLIQKIRDVENGMEAAFPMRNRVFDLLLPAYRSLGASVDKVVPGRDGWLFYEPDLLHLTGSGFLQKTGSSGGTSDPLSGVLDFYRQLQRRGIQLLVVPTPGKPSIVPEYLQQGVRSVNGPLKNPSWDAWVAALRRSGVDVLDVHELLWERKRKGQIPYLRTDTHWTPDAVDAVAEVVVKTVEPRLAGGPMLQMERRSVQVSNRGDIAVMVDRAASRPLHDPETVRIDQILFGGTIVSEDRSARVLLIGDSFSNIYSSDRMGWGEGAGFAEQLAFHLRQPIDRIVHNDAGAVAGRKALAAERTRGRDRLAGKRVVIWQFACRELSFGNWAPVPLEAKNAREASPGFLTPPAGKVLRISGVVSAASTVPTPGSVPYADHLMALHLTGVASADGSVSDAEALVYVFSMKAHRKTPLASLRSGERVCLDVRPWEEVEDRLGSINRSELEDESLLAAVPCWGEPIGE